MIDFLVFNATFSNISAISWRPVLVVEEAGVPGENHRRTMGKQLVNFITCGCESSAPFFVIYKAVLVIGLYELLSNLTTLARIRGSSLAYLFVNSILCVILPCMLRCFYFLFK